MVRGGLNLTERDQAIIEVLTHRVRVLSIAQIARTWFASTDRANAIASRRLRVLEQAGRLERVTMLARPELKCLRPVATWMPGDPAPLFESLSYALQARWTLPAVPTTMFLASRSSGVQAGGYGGRRPRRSEASHDVSLAALYLHMAATEPTVAQTWIPETRLRHRGFGHGAMLPDAIVEREGRSVVVEFGGAYTPAKLSEFHAFCRERGLPYEIW